MRIQFDVDTRPRKIGKLLKRAMDRLGYEFHLTQAQRVAARMFGYRDWIDLIHNLGAAPPTAFDAEVAPEIAAARRTQYVAVLVESGVPPDDVEKVVDEIGPTRSGACLRTPMDNDQQPILAPRAPREAVVVNTNRRTTNKVRTFNLDPEAD